MNRDIFVPHPIRIAYIIGKMWAGGVESVVFNYYREIDHSKFQFDFYYDEDSTVVPPQDLIDMGARFFLLPPYQKLSKYIRKLRYYFRKEKYQIVHSHLNTISVFPLYVAWREKVPIRIAHNHSVPGGDEFKRNIIKLFLRKFAKLFATDYFACSEKAGRWMFGDAAFDSGKVYIMKNAINFDAFLSTNDEADIIREKMGLNDKFVVGHVGRFTYAKNHNFLLEVFADILKTKPSSQLLLVGDGELRNQIVNKINDLGIRESVSLIGKVSDASTYYKAMDVVICPSVFEGLSLATVEAQAAGKNIVISEAVPNEAIISDGCHYMSIMDPPHTWAEKAIEVANREISYTDRKDEYEIKLAIKKLEKKYMSMLKNERNN